MRVSFYTLGCKVNQNETGALEHLLCQNGYTLAGPDEAADVYIVNSCTVTASGDRKSRQWLRRAKRQNPGAVTVLTGMLAGLPGLTPGVILQQGGQVVAAALTTFLVCMPMILIFGQMRGAYLGGSILTFFLGYCILFFKSGFLLSAYPFSAALVLAGFDMQEYNGATEAPSIPLALLGMAAVIGLTAAILAFSRPSSKAGSTKRKKAGGRGRRQAGRRTR